MSVFDKLRRDPAGPVTDPADHRLFSGSLDEMRQARREYARHSRARRIVNSGRDEIPLNELTPIRHGMLEHQPTGNWYRPFGGDPDYADAQAVPAYYASASGDLILLERAGSVQEFQAKQAAKEARKAAQEQAQRERWKQIKARA